MKKINPVYISLLTILSTPLFAHIGSIVSWKFKKDSGHATEVFFYIIYLAPVLGIISWVISLAAQKQWINTNKVLTIVFSLMLLGLLAYDIYYFVTL